MACTAFVDDSGSGGDSPYFALAGLVAETSVWQNFGKDWQLVLNSLPRIRYFKMSEAHSLNGEFSEFSAHERDARLRLLVDVILAYPVREASVLMPKRVFHYLKNVSLPREWKGPYLYSFIGIVTALSTFEYLLRSQRVDFVFDRQQKTETRVRRTFDRLRGMPPFYLDRIGSIEFKSEQDAIPLQAADFIAWQNRRFYCAKEPIRDELKRIHSERIRWYRRTLNERALKPIIGAAEKFLAMQYAPDRAGRAKALES
jgi:hypothetical protein